MAEEIKRASIRRAALKAEEHYRVLLDPNDPDYETEEIELNELVKITLLAPVGDADDFHNFAVDLARNSFDNLACEVLRRGLELFPRNCDLLSDFLQYGMNCGFREECKAYYERLHLLPRRRYTWRGFSFSINYLEQLADECESDEEFDLLANEMIELSDEYLRFLPYEEDAYRSRANIYKTLREPDKEVDMLKEGLSKLNSAPRCALQLADLLVERGEYEEALKIIPRGLSDNNKDQSAISEAYLYYLSGRAKLGLQEKSGEAFSEDGILSVFMDFNIALASLKNKSYRSVIYDKTVLLKNRYGIHIPEQFENLYDLVEG